MTPWSSIGLILPTARSRTVVMEAPRPQTLGRFAERAELFCRSMGLFGRAKTSSAMNTPIEHKAKPVKKRGLKKADLEMSFFFIRRVFLG